MDLCHVPSAGILSYVMLVQDLLGLIPGMSIAQWISGRLLAQGIRGLTWVGQSIVGSSANNNEDIHLRRRRRQTLEQEAGLSSAAAYAKAVKENRVREVYPSLVDSQ